MIAAIPSPSQGVWEIGPVPVRAYALAILAGIVVAIVVASRRWVARGGLPGTVGDVAIWAVPFGIIGGRLYHVITDHQLYFGPDGRGVVATLRIWDGGLGIWGAIALGGVGAWIGCRRRGIPLPPFADALAPGLLLAQAIGRWGNYFNQELFGSPTDLPWGLQIDVAHRPAGFADVATFHPTFLYESLWCLAAAGVVVVADRRFRMGHGRVFALYVALYCAGRLWWELLRIDEANQVLGLRLNVWTAVLVGLGAVVYLVVSARLRPGRETPDQLRGRAAGRQPAAPDEAGPDQPDTEPPGDGAAAPAESARDGAAAPAERFAEGR
ncbi:MAG: prolipoprotein diacylglyceryl transferase [Actinomycetota bacterium]|nr:MAG: prolipoprotein diacylglyceryl transferase [Actinomycetota bacterium]